ncbi:hypothetical protein T492DRAFT_832354 [Pavlovales sp. CCMP2436]|nr:hypothetical protein T492DRAFT_832354 [Pavlovales sp. CCMP2436]
MTPPLPSISRLCRCWGGRRCAYTCGRWGGGAQACREVHVVIFFFFFFFFLLLLILLIHVIALVLVIRRGASAAALQVVLHREVLQNHLQGCIGRGTFSRFHTIARLPARKCNCELHSEKSYFNLSHGRSTPCSKGRITLLLGLNYTPTTVLFPM